MTPSSKSLCRARSLLACACLLLPLACGDDAGSGSDESDEPLFPEDYASSYDEVRDCRPSGDHDLNNIRVLVNSEALTPYEDRTTSFPEGAIVLKEEYEFDDVECTGPIKQWTVMQRLAADSDENLGWSWQRVDSERNVAARDDSRCVGCHTGCGEPPDGYEGTCSIP